MGYMFFFFKDKRIDAVRFLHCSTNVRNYETCIETNLAGFTGSEKSVKEGDLIYLIVRKSNRTICGARGILDARTDSNPWRDKRYNDVFRVSWELCEEFPVDDVAKIEPNLKYFFMGKALNILKYDRTGASVVEWLDRTFVKYARKATISKSKSIQLPERYGEKQAPSNGTRTELSRIRIKNFRCFAEKIFEFDKHFNVLIGDNATGKTAVLDAVAIGIGAYFLGIDQAPKNTILYKDIRKNTFSKSREYQLPCEIEMTGSFAGHQYPLIWQRTVLKSNGNTLRHKDTNKLVAIAEEHQQLVRDNGEINLPVFNYYGTERLWRDKASKNKTIGKMSRLSGYVDSLESKSDSHSFVDWMRIKTYSEIQKRKRDDSLVLLQATIGCFLSRNQRIVFDIDDDSLVLEDIIENRVSKLMWGELSDGYRNIITMAADLAYRCYILNPHLGIHAAEKAEGVVLIDEIDLHLHPKWQRTVVDSFKKAFPNLQFIATTHSPFIVQSLKNEELIDLQGQEVTDDYRNMGIEDIAEAEMHVKQAHRSERFIEMKKVADEYYRLVQQGEQTASRERLRDIKARLEQLMIPFYDNPAYVSYLEMFKYPLDNK